MLKIVSYNVEIQALSNKIHIQSNIPSVNYAQNPTLIFKVHDITFCIYIDYA